MSFTPNIPASGQTLGSSRQQVLNNFAALRSTISQGSGNPAPGQTPNHIDVNNAGAGKHIFVQMPVQIPGPLNLPLSGEGGLITQTVGPSSELYYVRDAVNTYYQMTGSVQNSQQGFSVLFGGIRIQWFSLAAADGQVIVFPTPFTGGVYVIVGNEITNNNDRDFVKPINTGPIDFTLRLIRVDGSPQAVPQDLNFIAIGPI